MRAARLGLACAFGFACALAALAGVLAFAFTGALAADFVAAGLAAVFDGLTAAAVPAVLAAGFLTFAAVRALVAGFRAAGLDLVAERPCDFAAAEVLATAFLPVAPTDLAERVEVCGFFFLAIWVVSLSRQKVLNRDSGPHVTARM